ncbi:alkylation response protein AidB-like acyl-CoA dehydrogenase [Prauserella sediminis]|uniref:Alkylation response protein AidB-like acyl-CoA dehydrogenase n=1 Tax=Prauserella sediminis TaxID=577680 RepID=A0A839XZX5_9PSEU|nr:acyl-CoA dehydrogenase family protein [Prauserella sediminis]MBB3665596.1 alkylation response protein AidB-like acyl-CoA dehydrogenase [Prauserella sediminis]
MTLAVSDEQEELRRSVRRLLTDRASTADVRRVMETDEGHDPSVWALMADQLGLPAIALPEEYGGLGFGVAELSIVLEELGGALSPEPFLSSIALAARTLALSGDTEAAARWLPGLADGTRTAAFAVSEPGRDWTLEQSTTRFDGTGLTGVKTFVIDGERADLLLVTAATDEGPGLFVVEPDATVERTRLGVLDPTRRQARITFDATPALRVDTAPSRLRQALDLGVIAVAAEQVGVAQACLDLTVEYAKVRTQFGRPIGSFQAIKHKCADLVLELEAARSAQQHATVLADGGADTDPADLAAAAAVCGSWCGEVAVHVAKEAIQIHGGVGYTWEHDAHLYLKRAKSTELLFGTPAAHRARLADLLGIGGGAR